MANKKIIVQLAIPERKYVKVYHDFLDNSFLSVEEQMVFIALKSYVDFKEDSGEVFPSIATLCKRAKMSKPRTTKAIKGLIEKGIVKKVQRGLTKTNIYTLSDYTTMWTCDNVKDAAAIANNQDVKSLTATEHIEELERMGYKVQIKEKKPTPAPTKVTDVSTQLNNLDVNKNNTVETGSQDLERYTLDQIKQLFDYDIMIQNNPYRKQDIDSVMTILHTAMNTNKSTIRINGQDKPAMSVIAKLMKLNKESIMYAIGKFSEQTDRIKNTSAYMLTILYNAQEQYFLDSKNKTAHDTAPDKKIPDIKPNKPSNPYTSYHQRTYDYEELERQLLDRNHE